MTPEELARAIGNHSIEHVAKRLSAHEPDTEASGQTPNNASVATILTPSASGGLEALFIKRAHHPKDPWSGHMAFPGGRRDMELETLDEIARREVLEEVGVDLKPDMLIGRMHDMSGGRLQRHEMSVSQFVYYHPEPGPLTLDTSEVADAVWVPLEYLADPRNIGPYHYPLDPQKRAFPAFHYRGEYTIWGMTYRMVGNFLELFGVDLPLEGEFLTDVE